MTVPFILLTGTELEVLEDAHARMLGPGRVSADPEPGAAVREEARRSLTVRGLVGADGVLLEDEPLTERLALALDVRAGSEGVLVVERTVQVAERPVRAARVAHLTPFGACVEDVAHDDLLGEVHGLALLTGPAEVTQALTDVLVPLHAAPGTGPPRRVRSLRAADLVRDLGRPTVLAEISWAAADRGPGPRSAVDPGVDSWLAALGPRGCFGAARPTAGGGRDGREDVVLAPVDPEWVRDLVDRLVRAVVVVPGEEGTMTG
ncbi:hypothetical protein ACI3ET_06820 [Ornithinimicrobium sp. LYQ121]|uniref:hypothetical protein n=1 Tax=Ornithinimicrobium sp. LYQ121 TaxID=3378801 RepID=UPI003851EF42